jgi:TolA-binding protein
MSLNKSPGYFFCFLLITFSLIGCESLMTRGEVDQKKQMQDSVSNLQRNSADLTNRFADIESDLRSMNGRIEVLENKQGVANRERDKQKADQDIVVADQTKKITLLQEEVTRLSEAVGLLTSEMTALKTASASESGSSSAAKKDLFDQAEESFKAKDWKKAVLTYQKFRDSNPKSKKFAEATYKIGVAFQELGMSDEAKAFYDEVVAKFPQSAEARRAKARLKTLKK